MLELKDIFTVILAAGSLLLAVYSFRAVRKDKSDAGNVDLTKAHLTDSQLFRTELRTEITCLRFELKETNEKLDKAESKILQLETGIERLAFQKEKLEAVKDAEKLAFEGQIEKLQARMTALENVLRENGIPFEHI